MNANLLLGMFYGLCAQVITYIQLQGNIKYNWYQKYPMPMLLMSIPISWLFIKSVSYIVKAYDGEIWPSRLIGFGIGIIVFGFMSWLMFREPITTKTIICLMLSVAILAIQIWWK